MPEVTAAVGSTNPVKVEAARLAFADMFGDASTIFFTSVASGVPDQPMTTREALHGATNRAVAAVRNSGAEYGVGLEGGLDCVFGKWYCIGWAVVADRQGGLWSAPCAGLMVPHAVMRLVLMEELELGDAIDRVFGRSNSKQKGGLIGVVTDEHIDRLEVFRVPLLTALYSMRLDRADQPDDLTVPAADHQQSPWWLDGIEYRRG